MNRESRGTFLSTVSLRSSVCSGSCGRFRTGTSRRGTDPNHFSVNSTASSKEIFPSIDAYISGSVDAGLFHIAGKPSAGVSLERAEAAVRDELDRLQQELVDGQELEKVKNKFESTQIFGNINYLNVATNLAWFELLGKAEDLEKEVERYRSVTAMQLREVAQSAFRKENGVVLYYKSK